MTVTNMTIKMVGNTFVTGSNTLADVHCAFAGRIYFLSLRSSSPKSHPFVLPDKLSRSVNLRLLNWYWVHGLGFFR